MSDSMRPRVMLVEDYVPIRRQLCATFRGVLDIACFDTIAEAEPHIAERWDGHILDRRLPDGDGIALAQRILAQDPAASIVLFTGDPPEATCDEATRHGIVYAHKTAGIALLKQMAATWVRAFTPARTSLGYSDRLAQLDSMLTMREREIILLRYEGLTRAQAARRLAIGESTHRQHVTDLLRKTGFDRLAQLIAWLNTGKR